MSVQLTVEQMQAELARLREENAKLQAAPKPKGNGIKVSEKGAVSVYGLGSWPVTLYQEQMIALLDRADEIRKFIVDNQGKLKVRPTDHKSVRQLAKEQGLDSIRDFKVAK